MTLDPSTGPVPREKFAEIVNAPYGQAAKLIRKYDPMWGREEGEKIKWRVECSGTMTGTAYVEASSEEEAMELADKLSASDVDWDGGRENIEIESVEPKP